MFSHCKIFMLWMKWFRDACGLLCVVINTMLYYIIKETFQTFIIKTKTCVINFDEIHRNIFVLLGCIVVVFFMYFVLIAHIFHFCTNGTNNLYLNLCICKMSYKIYSNTFLWFFCTNKNHLNNFFLYYTVTNILNH